MSEPLSLTTESSGGTAGIGTESRGADQKWIVRWRNGYGLRFVAGCRAFQAVEDSEATVFGSRFEAAEAVRLAGLRACTLSIEEAPAAANPDPDCLTTGSSGGTAGQGTERKQQKTKENCL